MNFRELVVEVLQKSKESLNNKEIWEESVRLGLHKKLKSYGKTPWETISAYIYTDMKKMGEKSIFIMTSKKPTKFALRAKKQDKNTISFRELAKIVLEKAQKPLNLKEIWQNALELGLDTRLMVKSSSPTTNLAVVMSVDKKHKKSLFERVGLEPFTYKLKNKNFTNLIPTQESLKIKEKFKERDLHPLLVKFLDENPNFNLKCKTVYHEKSTKGESGKDKWNYPDIVGVYFPDSDYNRATLELLSTCNQNSLKLFSFELKINLDFSNLKQSYFQAVSNSSWANEGYLVVFEELDDELLSELNRLNQSFGIGVIKLEREPLNSRIILNARKRELDAQTINMLLEKNPDFKHFINDINNKIKVGLVSSGSRIYDDFDKVLSDEELLRYLKEKL